MTKPIQRIAIAFLVAFFLLALLLGRWSLASADLTARDDNPRRVFAEELIQRGSILDRNDLVLAETIPQSGTLIRHYPLIAAAPVVGYDSINYGLSGIEEALDGVLRGPANAIDQLLHRRQSGQNVRLTIDANMQRLLSDRLTQPGAAVVLSLPDGAVLALASNPSFDPNTLDENWKALSTDPTGPLLNRVTQGLYQPGAVFQSVLLADALAQGAHLTDTLTRADRPLILDRLTLQCGSATQPITTLSAAYAAACPAPFADLAAHLTATQALSLTQQWKLDQPPAREIRTSAAPTLTFDLSTTQALQAFGAGQGELTVSPLQMALVAATLGNNGYMPKAFVVKDVQTTDDKWSPYLNTAASPMPVIDPAVARALLEALPAQDNTLGHGGAAYSGDREHAWFMGLAPADQPKYAIAVLLEDPQNASDAEALGRDVLKELSGTP